MKHQSHNDSFTGKRAMLSNKNLIYFLILIVVIIILFYFFISRAPYKIGVVGKGNQITEDKSAALVFSWLEKETAFEPVYIPLAELTGDKLSGIEIVWVHEEDTTDDSKANMPLKTAEVLQAFITDGGKILLTEEAAMLISTLGLDPAAPQVNYMAAKDGGYGRKMGLHAFLDHPVFKGLHGGAFIFGPQEDVNCRQIGYFKNNLPQKGRTIAVDWAYIQLKEQSRLMLEFKKGQGKAISIGSYILLDMPNQQQLQMDQFLRNTLNYLASDESSEGNYWSDAIQKVNQTEHNTTNTTYQPDSSWQVPDFTGLPVIYSNNGTGDYIEASGRRILLVGKESGGIEEIWAHPFMAIRDYEVGVSFKDSILWLSDQEPEIRIYPGMFLRQYKFRRAYLREWVVVSPDKPEVIVRYEYRGVYPAKLHYQFRSNLRRMWPYSEQTTGNINYNWDATANAFFISNEAGDMTMKLGASKAPDWYHLGNSKEAATIPFAYPDQKSFNWGFSGAASYELAMNEDLYIAMAATSESATAVQSDYVEAMSNPQALFSDVHDHVSYLLANRTQIISPDKQFNEAYQWALLASDMFLVETPGLGQALVAGYASSAHGWDGAQKVSGRPGYAWYFGRDGQWSSMALLDYGDTENVRKQLEFYLKFQDINGKIFHEVSTSGVVHYDASDATPLFIALVGKYLKHSGDIDFVKTNWPQIKRALDFCYATDVNHDNLIENVNVGHGWVEGGHLYGSQSTLYLSACWAEALAEAAYMAGALNKDALAASYANDAKDVRGLINGDFWNAETHFFNHGKYPDGTYNPALTVMPAIPIYFQQIEESKIMPVLAQFAGNGFTSDWGVRIVPESSKYFNPRGYHTGSVWPLYTGWAALAEYAGGKPLQGFQHATNNLKVYENWGSGYIEEVLDGLEYKPMGVCHHQCWSETMALQPLLEGMLGFKPDALSNSLELALNLPPQWDSLEVKNLRLGDTYLTVKMQRINDKTSYRFMSTDNGRIVLKFKPSFPPGTSIREVSWQGQPLEYKVTGKPEGFVDIALEFNFQGAGELEIKHRGGISVLPLNPQPKPGTKSRGFRLLTHKLTAEGYKMSFEGKAGNTESFSVYCPDWPLLNSSDVELVEKQGAISTYRFVFDKGEGYKQKTILLGLKK